MPGVWTNSSLDVIVPLTPKTSLWIRLLKRCKKVLKVVRPECPHFNKMSSLWWSTHISPHKDSWTSMRTHTHGPPTQAFHLGCIIRPCLRTAGLDRQYLIDISLAPSHLLVLLHLVGRKNSPCYLSYRSILKHRNMSNPTVTWVII